MVVQVILEKILVKYFLLAPSFCGELALLRDIDALVMLAGGGLFVGCVVAGAIMLANGGAKARGALMRDVGAYCIGVVTITAFMWTGEMTFFGCAVLLVIYAAFVFTVLGADLWHIFMRLNSLCTWNIVKKRT